MAASRIVVLSDGTGNAASSVWRTNVWRLFQALDLRGDDQAAKYDDGVGTSTFKPVAILGGVFGYGLKRNILEAYKFVCRNYDADAPSKIYLFGFSRGAFTARVLAALILDQGLVRERSEGALHDGAVRAYRAYRAKGYHSNLRVEVPFRFLRDRIIVPIVDKLRGRKSYAETTRIPVPMIEFVGVWDTVAAYGLPIDEMTRGVSSWIWPLELPNRILNDRVRFARHALALDDERTTFHPVLWTEQREGETAPSVPDSLDGERLVQVWFTGMHANVGGGYPDDALAYVPLYWLLKEAERFGLIFKTAPFADPDAITAIRSGQDKDGRLYDSRAGLGAYYRYGPRKVHDLCNDRSVGVHVPMPKIHASVFGRIDSGCNAYAPIGLPEKYVIVGDGGSVSRLGPTTYETPEQARARFARQERLWNFVWLRRVAYFATLAASLHLAAFFFFHDLRPDHEFDNHLRLVSETVRLVESFLPRLVHWWTDAYAANPEWFVGGIAALAALMWVGSSLDGRIKDGMRVIWQSRGATAAVPASLFHRVLYAVRTSWLYVGSIRLLKRHILPLVLVAASVWFAATGLSHLAFNLADSTGAFCKGSSPETIVAANLGTDQPAKDFATNSLCAPTGLSVRAGFRYEITVTVGEPWTDGGRAADPIGYRTSTLEAFGKASHYGSILLRRVLFRPWFRLIARVGENGIDEYFLDPKPVKNSAPNHYKARFLARRNGEIFLYVNDAVLGLPWLHSHFLKNNRGTAKITLKLL